MAEENKPLDISKTLIQIGKKFFSLKYEFSIKTPEELKRLLDSQQYDIKLLQEGA